MDDDQVQKISLSVPLGAIVATVVLAVVAFAYFLSQGNGSTEQSVQDKAQTGKGLGRRLGLRTAVTLIENDVTRKVLVAALKALARRS